MASKTAMRSGIGRSHSQFSENAELMQNEKQALWDIRFMQLAQHIGQWSKDRSRGVGCVIVGSDNDILATGYNGFPRGINDDIEERHGRPLKYLWTEHAERNAIYNAARRGIPLENSRMYLPWYPCVDCARAIVQCRIAELIALEPNWNDPQWSDHFRTTRELLAETKLLLRFLDPKSLAAAEA
jgi:dCMP deaminase